MCISLFQDFVFASFGVSTYIQFFFDVLRNKIQTKMIYPRVGKKKINKKKKNYAMSMCFKFWPIKNDIFLKLSASESLIIACLQI